MTDQHPTKILFRFAGLFVVLSALAPAQIAHAGGFFLFDRGAVAVSRGGAFVAGADNADAVYYNPAGLLSAGHQLQVDVAMPRLNASFQRNNSGAMPRVDGSQAPLPTPTIAYANNFGLRRWAFGVGVFTPSAIVQQWPKTIDVGGTTQDAPQRYSLYNLNGTILASAAAGAAFDAGHGLSFGVSLGVNIADFNILAAVSGCDGGLVCANAEDPNFDSRVKLSSGLKLAPLATFGVRFVREQYAIGASFSTPYRFRGNMDMDASIPPIFAASGELVTDSGARPHVHSNLRFPWVARVGFEIRPMDNLRAELAYVVEGWNVQQNLTFTPQDNLRIYPLGTGVPGLVYPIVPIVVQRQMLPTHSFRAGAQYHVGAFDIRAGLAYETRSFPDRTLSPLTLDNNKTILSAGGTAHLGEHVLLDLTFAYAFIRDPNITNSIVTQNVAIPPNATDVPPSIVGNGKYDMDAWYIGAGLRWQISQAPQTASR